MRAYKRQRGFTLTEVLVATAIFTIIMLAALLMYDRNNRVFKSGVQASDVQQNTRVGFDKLVSDLRIEGFDYNRNGDVSGSDEATGINYQKQPDEQIEYMGASAIAFRANFNYNTGYDNGREGNKRTAGKPTDTYESPAFPLVTTSNSEIVIYALKSAKAAANTSVISFYADVSKPRAAYVGAGGTPKEKLVNITGYDTTNNNPPYTLYRLTMKDANLADSDPDPVGNADPIATNIRSLRFIYYTDQGGTAPDQQNGIPPVNGDGQYDASNAQNPIPQRLTRSSIQAVRVELIGMESAPDSKYSSPLETSGVTDTAGVPASQYRQYRLTSLVVPRNVGKRAVKEEQLRQPQPATLKTVCYGACSVPYLTWQAPKDGNVDFYAIVYDVDNTSGGTCATCSFSNGYPVGNVTEAYFPRPLNPGNHYFFKIEASNGYGDSLSQETGSIYAKNTTTPNPATASAVTNLNNRVRLTWQTPSYYYGTPSLTCVDPLGSPAASNAVAQNGIAPPEVIAYRVYRAQGSANANFDPSNGEGELIASETNGNQPYVDVNGVATLDDYVPACIDFYYRIQAVAADCANNKDYNEPAQTSIALSTFEPKIGAAPLHGKATSAARPAAPQNFIVTRPAACPAAGTLRGANVACSLTLTWDKVTQDTSSPAQPVKIDNYILTRTQIQPSTGTAVTINVPGQWDTLQAGNGGNTITYTDANLPMTDAAGRSYQYTYSLVADTNLCSASSAAVTSTEPLKYFSISGEPVTATTSDGGDGSLLNPYQLYGGSSTFVFTGTGLTGITAYVSDAAGNSIKNFSGFASPFTFTVPTGLNTGQEYSVDFIVTNGTGYYTETVYFVQQGGVCDYKTAPSPVSSATQTNNGLTIAKPWSLQPGQTIKWTASDLASAAISIIDTTNNNVVKTFTPTGTTETITWPTLTYGNTYEVDAILTSNVNCQREQFYFVTQVCSGYGGGTAAFTVSDLTHTGLTSASAWQIITGGTIKVTESSMKSLKITVTDLTANKIYTTATYTAASGVVNITWPPTNVTAAQNDVFQMDIVLVDSNGCTSSTYTRYATQYCTYSGSTPTVSATQTLRNTTDALGLGTSSSPYLMVPNVDMITLTESKIAVAYIDYLDTNGNALAIGTQTWTGSSPLKFSNPVISGYNGKAYRIDITLADSGGCKTSTKFTYYVKQVPCVLKPQQNATDTSIIANPVNLHGAGGNYSTVVTLFNKTNQSITINSVKLTFGALGGTNQIQDVVFTNGTVTTNSATSPLTVTAPSGNTIAANGSTTFTIDYNYKPGTNPLTSVCVTYTTSTNTPTTTATQSCNIQYSASSSVLNPSGCD